MNGATAALLDGIGRIAGTPLPPRLAHVARLRLMDGLGCILAGAAEERARLERLAGAGGPGRVPLLGLGRGSPPLMAALVNGAASHVVELDDGHRYGITHAGGPLVAALVSVADDPRVTADSFLKGIVAGYEAALRVARACQPAAKDRGWHGTGTFGCIGAAVGVAVALGADAEGRNAALAAAATSAGGMIKGFAAGSELKPLNAGQPAQSGLAAALFADAGFAGPPGILDGPHGFLQLMRGSPADPAALAVTDPLCIETVYLKPYASCRYCHAPVEAVTTLRATHGIDPARVAAIRVETYRLAVQKHDHIQIDGPYSAKLGIPYCVGVALNRGLVGMGAFAPAELADPGTLRLMRLTRVTEDPAMTAMIPHRRPARVTVVLDDGRELSERVDLPRGEPETPLSEAELTAKFIDLAGHAGIAPGPAGDLAARLLDPGSAPMAAIHAINGALDGSSAPK